MRCYLYYFRRLLQNSLSLITIVSIFMGSTTIWAQDTSRIAAPQRGFIENNIRFTGNLGFYGELYNMSGIESRRPSSTGRILFRPTLTLYNSMTLAADFFISTEGKASRQSISQFDLNPSWSWGSAHLGDFADTYSSLTLGGIKIRGAGVSINPGKFRFSTVFGQTRRATSNSSADRSFSRQIYGGRIGVGKKTGSYFDLIILKSKDKSSSLPPLTDSTSIPDSTRSDSGINPWSLYPEENLVMGLCGNLELFKQKLSWKNELAGSAFTRNTGGTKITEDIPSWADNVFKFRIGSQVDVAYKTSMSYQAKNWNVASGFEFIGPGYNSLGIASLDADKQGFFLNGYLRKQKWSFGLNGSLENDNLIDQKTYTTSRQRLNGSINYRPVRWWNVIFTGNVVNISNDADNDTAMVDNIITMVGLNQVISLGGQGIFQNASVNYVGQLSTDKNPVHYNTDMHSHSFDIRVTAKATENLNVSPSIMVIRSRIGNANWLTTSNYMLNLHHKMLAEKLSSDLTFGPSHSDNTNLFKITLTTLFKLTPMDYIQFDLRYSHFKGSANTQNYNEFIGNLSVSHKF
jgi:hypothetical protein